MQFLSPPRGDADDDRGHPFHFVPRFDAGDDRPCRVAERVVDHL